ncbi:S8 family serine peptidase [Kribbella sp. NPDC056951]|uniref:S8 family serine peptidase n=1 Tax=Kribbella sp. NPDC056951 TaxID=3345978 RepID=UPI00363964CB
MARHHNLRSIALIGAALASVTLLAQTPAYAAAGTQPNPSGALDRIDQRDRPLDKSYSWNSTGAGVRVYVLSDGVSTTHTDFGGRASQGADLVGGTECTVFGTGVAGLVAGTKYGVAKQAQIVAIRTFKCNALPTADRAIAGVNWVTQNAVKPAVAVLPFAVAADPALDAAVAQSIQSGVTWVVSAGNNGTDFGADACNYSPARVAGAITATQLDLTNTGNPKEVLGAGQNRGRCVDVAAPSGTTAVGGGSDENPWGIHGGHAGVTAGAAAKLLEQYPTASPATIQQLLNNNATTGRLTPDSLGTPDRILFSN